MDGRVLATITLFMVTPCITRKNSPFSMAKLNLTTSKYDYRVIEKASATFSYSFSANQNMDFSAVKWSLPK